MPKILSQKFLLALCYQRVTAFRSQLSLSNITDLFLLFTTILIIPNAERFVKDYFKILFATILISISIADCCGFVKNYFKIYFTLTSW